MLVKVQVFDDGNGRFKGTVPNVWVCTCRNYSNRAGYKYKLINKYDSSVLIPSISGWKFVRCVLDANGVYC